MTPDDAAWYMLPWLREALAWIALSLAGGTLFGLRRGTPTFRAWIGVLLRSVIVGFIASRVISETHWDEGWRWVAVTVIAFGADAIIIALDEMWRRVAEDPVRTAKTVVEWVARRRIVLRDENGEKKGKDDTQ